MLEQPVAKIFIIGLPRTATTSVCQLFLQLGYLTAHTAYTKQAFSQAQVVADTPVFAEFERLDLTYPNSKFIYLTRELDKWLPSIKQLLQRMATNLLRQDGGFNPHLKRCYQQIFSPFTLENIADDYFLRQCYVRHNARVMSYFNNREHDLLTLDVTDASAIDKLLNFLSIDSSEFDNLRFEQVNMAGKVTAWNDIRHPLKVASTRAGKIDSTL